MEIKMRKKKYELSVFQKFKVSVVMSNGVFREVFEGMGQESYEKVLAHAKRISELNGDSIQINIMSNANVSRH